METLVNFRDIGGYLTEDGRKVKTKKILRSGEVINLCEQDKNKLVQDYRLKKIIDFRGDKEVTEKPDDVLHNVYYEQIDVMKQLNEKTASQENLSHSMNRAQADEMMMEIYYHLMTEDTAHEGYRKLIQHLITEKDGSLLFHCFAGKDRTGVAAAIVLKLLGVNDQDIVQDYLKTNEERKAANALLIEEARQQGVEGEALLALNDVMTVKRDYLKYAYDTMLDKFGSFSAYIQNGLGIHPHEVEALQAIYLENGE